MRFAELDRYRPRLERELRAQYARESSAAPAFRPDTRRLAEFTLRGGKRFRALLVLAGYHLASRADPAPALPAAAALEHFQSWMLIHDDIIDHAMTRRGGPAVHRQFEQELAADARPAEAAEYGIGMGITLGDLEEPYTVAALLGAPGPAERRLAAIAEYVRMTRATAYGQLLDIRLGHRPVAGVTESEVLRVHRLKTAIYTVASPLRIGAILGGARPGRLADLEAIGTDLGIAFQLRDDVLGAGFDGGASGKSANDLTEGKRTLLVVRAYATGDAAARSALEAVLGRADADPAAIDRAREALRSSGSLAYSEARIAQLARRADRRIGAAAGLRAADRDLLREIGRLLLTRSR